MWRLPFGDRVLCDSPALSSSPGHTPTHDARAFSDRKAAASGPLRRSSAAPNPPRNRALPPLVAPRLDALGEGPRLPDPVARSAPPSTATPPAPSSAAGGKLHAVPCRHPAHRAILPAWPAAGDRPEPPERPGRFPLPPVLSTCAAH